MKKLLFLAFAAALYACGGDHAGHDHADHDNADSVQTATPVAQYGEAFDTTGAMPISQLAANLEAGNATGVYSATIVESCQKMGCWMSVGVDSTSMKVYMGDHAFFVPKQGVDGLNCFISGTAYYDTVSVEMQQHLLEDANASQEEIDAITEAKYELAFTATGVMIEGYEAPEGEAEEMEDMHEDHDHEGHEHAEGEEHEDGHESGDYDGD